MELSNSYQKVVSAIRNEQNKPIHLQGLYNLVCNYSKLQKDVFPASLFDKFEELEADMIIGLNMTEVDNTNYTCRRLQIEAEPDKRRRDILWGLNMEIVKKYL
jgi:hypothetical protein